jgi:RNA polymerase sigma-70 factor (sigma-E family)
VQSVITPTFDEYVVARSSALLRFAYLLCADRHLAEDLLQEVLVKAHRRWSAIEADNPDAYLKQALVRTHISWNRRRSSSEVPSAYVPESAYVDAFDDRHASRDEVWAMLATLSPTQRAVLVLRYYEDLDDRRIAELVAISPSTVRVHAHRGLRALRETLADQAAEAPTGTHVAEAVEQGVARAARRRRATAAGTVAVAVVVALVLAVVVPRVWPSTGLPPAGPTPSSTPSPTGSPPPVPMQTINLPAVQGYPYFADWTPPAYEFTYNGLEAGRWWLQYGTQTDGYVINVTSVSMVPDWQSPQTSNVTVNGVPATLRTAGTGAIALAWQRDAMWFTVVSTPGALSSESILRVAQSIKSVMAQTVQSGLSSIEIPTDWVLDRWVPDSFCAKPNNAPPDDSIGISIGICVTISSPDPAPTDVRDVLQLDSSGLTVHRSDNHLVKIRRYIGSVPPEQVPGLGLTDELVVAMYRGLTFH